MKESEGIDWSVGLSLLLLIWKKAVDNYFSSKNPDSGTG